MKKRETFNVIGIMTGTSMDGIDLSYVKTDGKKNFAIICEKNYNYSLKYQNLLKKIIQEKPDRIRNIKKYFSEKEIIFDKQIIKYVNLFIDKFKINKKNINFLSISGQTVLHKPEIKLTIQLGNLKRISNSLKINCVGNFRIKDISKGGQGAPIGAYYHKYLLQKIDSKALIVNFGGVSNFSILKNNKVISSDLGPANSISDDLTNKYYYKKYDKFGKFAAMGSPNKRIIYNFSNDIFFKKKFPKSLDRNYFNKYLKKLCKIDKNDSICTSIHLIIKSIEILLKEKDFINIKKIIVTGGGRKNKYLMNILKDKFMPIQIKKIDDYGYNGDLIESQMFGYLGIRSLKKLTISSPSTTGVNNNISGGIIYKYND